MPKEQKEEVEVFLMVEVETVEIETVEEGNTETLVANNVPATSKITYDTKYLFHEIYMD